MKFDIKPFIIALALVFLVGAVDLSADDSSGEKAKDTGKRMWKNLKKDIQEVKTTVKEEGKKAHKGAKRNLKESKQTLKTIKKKTATTQTGSAQDNKSAAEDP